MTADPPTPRDFSQDANLIRSTLESVINERGLPGSGLSDQQAREALTALARLVMSLNVADARLKAAADRATPREQP